MSWCFLDEANAFTRAVLAALETGRALVPSVWTLEVGNTLLVAERRRRIESILVAGFRVRLARMPIVVERDVPGRNLDEILYLARKHQLSTYDAAYLDLAMRKGLPLATQDKALIRAAAECSVALFQP